MKEGRDVGVFETYEECEAQVKGHPGACYRAFVSEDDAYDYLRLEGKAFVCMCICVYLCIRQDSKIWELPRLTDYGNGYILARQSLSVISEFNRLPDFLDYGHGYV